MHYLIALSNHVEPAALVLAALACVLLPAAAHPTFRWHIDNSCSAACRKVMGLLAAQLLLTVAIAAPIVGHAATRSFVAKNVWIVGLSMVTNIVLVLVLMLSKKARHSHPTNLVLLGAFTATEGVLLGVISSSYQLQAVLLAAGLTAIITVGLAVYALQTKHDFTMQGGLLLTLLLGLVFTGVLAAFTRSPAMHLLLAGLGAVLFGAYIVYDVQLLAGNVAGEQAAVQLSPDEYVVGAIMVYVDIVNLFLHLLRFIAEMQRN